MQMTNDLIETYKKALHVLKACGAEQEEDPAFEAYVSRRRATEPAEAGAEAEYPPRDQLQDEWRSLDEEQKQPILEQYGEARRRTTWTEVKDAVEQFCEGGEDTVELVRVDLIQQADEVLEHSVDFGRYVQRGDDGACGEAL